MNLNLGLLHYIFDGEFHTLAYSAALFAVLCIAYLLGSVNSAIIISRLRYGEDIRTKGSGNAGMTNMLRNYGKGAAGLTLLGDLLKTVFAVGIAGLVFGFGYARGAVSVSQFCYLAGLFAVLGHVFPIYYKFKGGKGVLVTSTMALMLSPGCFLLLFLLFVLIVGTSKYVSLGSVTVAMLYPVVLAGYFEVFSLPTLGLTMVSAILLAILIVWCHRENLRRISERRENKISFGKKKDKND